MAARDRLIRALFITEKQCADGKLREQANRDINDAIAYYLSESAAQASHGFIDSMEQAYTHISRHPATGSPRYAHELNLPGLRYWPLTRYPHLADDGWHTTATYIQPAGLAVV